MTRTRTAVRLLKVISVGVVVAVFTVAILLGEAAKQYPVESARARELASLSTTGLGLTLGLGLAVGFSWLLHRGLREHPDRPRA